MRVGGHEGTPQKFAARYTPAPNFSLILNPPFSPETAPAETVAPKRALRNSRTETQ